MSSRASEGATTFVLFREKVRAVRSVRATDGIVLEAQEALSTSIVQQKNTITQSRGYLCNCKLQLRGEAVTVRNVSCDMLRLLGCS